jgi:predicted dehydrogenase
VRNSNALSVGIVGAGEIVRRVHLPVLLNIPEVRIAWIYDQRPERARAIARSHQITAASVCAVEALPFCDVALLAIPVEARGEYLKHFARSGSAVFCEKPFATTAAQHSEIVAAFSPHTLACGYMRRFYRSSAMLRHLVVSGLMGRLLSMTVSEGNRSKGSGVDASFLDNPHFGSSRGVLMDLGSHAADLALFLSGAHSFKVKSCNKELDRGIDRKVSASIDLQCGSGSGATTVELRYGVSWLDPQTNRLCLQFERTMAWSGLAVGGQVFLGDPNSPRDCVAIESSLSGATTFNQAFYLEWKDFLDGVRNRRESLVSARSALLTTTLIEQLLTSDASR